MINRIIKSLSKKKGEDDHSDVRTNNNDNNQMQDNAGDDLDKFFAGNADDQNYVEHKKVDLSKAIKAHEDLIKKDEDFLESLRDEVVENKNQSNTAKNNNIPKIPTIEDANSDIEKIETHDMPDGHNIPDDINPVGGSELMVDDEIEKELNDIKDVIDIMDKDNSMFKQGKVRENNVAKVIDFDLDTEINKEPEPEKPPHKTFVDDDFLDKELEKLQAITSGNDSDRESSGKSIFSSDDFEIIKKDGKKYKKSKGKRVSIHDKLLTERDKKKILKKEKEIDKRETKLDKQEKKLKAEQEKLEKLKQETTDLKKTLTDEEKSLVKRIGILEKDAKSLEKQREQLNSTLEKVEKERANIEERENINSAKEDSLKKLSSDLDMRKKDFEDSVENAKKDIVEKQELLLDIREKLNVRTEAIEKREKEIEQAYEEAMSMKKEQFVKLERIDDMEESLIAKEKDLASQLAKLKKAEQLQKTIDKLYKLYDQIRLRIKEEYKKLDDLHKLRITGEKSEQHDNEFIQQVNQVKENLDDSYKRPEEPQLSEAEADAVLVKLKGLIKKGIDQAVAKDLKSANGSLAVAKKMYESLPKTVDERKKKEIYYDLLMLKHEVNINLLN